MSLRGAVMEQRWVAFLRGINLGRRRVTNDELEDALAGLGFEQVTAYQASGNLVLDPGSGGSDTPDPEPWSAKLEARVESAVLDGLGFEAEAFVRTLGHLADLLGAEALHAAEEEGFKPHVIFLKAAPDAEARTRLAELETEDDRFPVLGREVFWLRRGRLTDSAVETRHLEAALGGVPNTMRTVGTVRRIVGKFGA